MEWVCQIKKMKKNRIVNKKKIDIPDAIIYLISMLDKNFKSVLHEYFEIVLNSSTHIKNANRKTLNYFGESVGIKRKYFGFEFNKYYRKRILDSIRHK